MYICYTCIYVYNYINKPATFLKCHQLLQSEFYRDHFMYYVNNNISNTLAKFAKNPCIRVVLIN